MITDKKLGLKVAETQEEATWENLRRTQEQNIKALTGELMISREVLKLAERKLLEIGRNHRPTKAEKAAHEAISS